MTEMDDTRHSETTAAHDLAMLKESADADGACNSVERERVTYMLTNQVSERT